MKNNVYNKVMRINIDRLDFMGLIEMMWNRSCELRKSGIYDYCLIKVFQAYNANTMIISPDLPFYQYAGPVIQESINFVDSSISQSINQL